ncbi:TetR/AcrR family transcriptional regulator [Streptomyces sp. NPDC005840]|jgi:AcrR family transcriptional regulator|uniref:TetR/AcrR family transcriptional regulator n=2 Tax=Streptomyces TaxID=1883 RepID=A0ABD5ESJ1_9ACTN|nr:MULTISPECIES: TetR/AcrR family transcriptional regulator [unclassified Streptomyces]MDT0437299.1 TetR/AcrR family transcriptional regulator [Streptomyces sp. DSM 41981]MYQ64645.1 TetR family transcriptional regulator [Streptomyces sp. SID4950]SCD83199.1 transcriptional regulator, TetR family [Streptomyces sp. SolWspMP-5a-2]
MTDAPAPAPRRRPGGRTARTGQAVHDAVRALLAERGQGGFTGRDVAERAGVHEATIYRRWGSLDTLLLDVAATVSRLNEDSPLPDTGTLRGDLLTWASAMATDLEGPEGLGLLRSVLAVRTSGDERADRVSDFVYARAEAIQRVLDRARQRGEAVPELLDVLERLVAPLYFRAIFAYRRPDAGLAELVDNALAAAARE